MEEVMKEYFKSWPAMLATGAVLITTLIVFKFPNEVKNKIKGLISLGGNKGANWNKNEGGKLPGTGLEKINKEYEKADEIILGLQSQNDELLKIAQGLNRELEDTKIMLFFERVLRATLIWQYFLLKVGCESQDRKITIEQAVIKIREEYPDFDQYVTDESIIATLDDLQTINFVRAIRPYTKDTPLEFTELTASFMVYANSGSLTT